MRPPRPSCSICLTAPSLRAGRCARRAGSWSCRSGAGTAGSAAAPAGGWRTRRRAGRRCTGCWPVEVDQILTLFEEWGETDRSHRKLAHRGSYLGRVWVSPSSVRRVLFLADKHFRPLPRPGRSVRKPFPDWVEYRPNSLWIYDTTHFTAAGMAVLIVEDLVSRKWLSTVVSVEETSTQVEIAFTDALEAEGLLELIDARRSDGTVDLGVDQLEQPLGFEGVGER